MELFEDNLEDIISKAQRGLEMPNTDLAKHLNCDPQQLRKLRRGDFDTEMIDGLAKALNLSARALRERMMNLNEPVTTLPESIYCITSNCADMRVNAWLLLANDRREALLFDTGAEIGPLQLLLDHLDVPILHLFLTHTHHDHIALVGKLCQKFAGLKLFAPEKETIEGAQLMRDGAIIDWGGWRLQAIATPGHSIGGTSYAIYPQGEPAAAPIAIVVGDALFCGSIGGIRTSAAGMTLRDTYLNALKTIRSKLLIFPAATLLLPGHGPATTVAWEKSYNPFFADSI
jgi:hydroxyacylglutathione hydrolase